MTREGASRTRFRQAAGRFATGITVVTVATANAVRGMTANSFVSVSLEPPLVLVSIARTAEMHRMLASAGAFGISVLSEEQVGYSRLFAGADVGGLTPRFQDFSGVPTLAGSLCAMACGVHRRVKCGDHTLFIGRVRDLRVREARPLLYYGSGYRSIGDSLQPEAASKNPGNPNGFGEDKGSVYAVGW